MCPWRMACHSGSVTLSGGVCASCRLGEPGGGGDFSRGPCVTGGGTWDSGTGGFGFGIVFALLASRLVKVLVVWEGVVSLAWL